MSTLETMLSREMEADCPFTVECIERDEPDARHVHLTFPNGYTLSVRQFGRRSYSDAESVELYCYASISERRPAWPDVRGWQTYPELIKAIHEVARYRP